MSKRFGETLTEDEEKFLEAQKNDVEPPEPEDSEDDTTAPEPEQQQAKEENVSRETNLEETLKPKKNIKVPLHELEKEREQRQSLQKLLEVQTKASEEAQRNLEALQRAYQSQQPVQPQAAQTPVQKVISPDDDPIENLRQVNKELKDLRDFQANVSRQQQQYTQIQRIQQATYAKESEFKQKQPDYDDAANFLRSSYEQELRIQGYNEQQIGEVIASEVLRQSDMALKSNQNPAERFYSLAKSRGYQIPSRELATNGNSEAEKFSKIAAGQRANVSLSQANGSSPRGDITYETLANMSEAEFAKVSKENPAKVRQIMGG